MLTVTPLLLHGVPKLILEEKKLLLIRLGKRDGNYRFVSE